MNNVFTTCDRCNTDIYYGNAYVAIARNVEQANHSILTNSDEVQVINSELLITLCGSCGNTFHFDNITKLISALPINSTFDKNN